MKWYGWILVIILWLIFWISIDTLTGIRYWGALISTVGLVILSTFYDYFVGGN